jgi:hypothetical protein
LLVFLPRATSETVPNAVMVLTDYRSYKTAYLVGCKSNVSYSSSMTKKLKLIYVAVSQF